ncbi:alpha/beta fold hydrolase [Sinosporangium siamense]|uniref:Alpha/beta hydrolase n=1 Tax=Sinosporangium siamense TaxID=1367973 RepID=A0A919RJL1_9ACTN|nr:alpha/beta hydrolase [Sinosporangium siamense]GII94993.1 alpha/beta hydrolase [Sinosporangium siamense]
MTESKVISRDGTEIAFEQAGSGPALILVSSALADRSDARKLAALLSEHFTVINYDRRGRGASGNTKPYAVEREIEDIAALIDHAGGSASVFGSSSGAVLSLRATAAGLAVRKLAVYEPPFAVEGHGPRETGGDGFGPPAGFGERIATLLAQGRRGDAVASFMSDTQGMPKFMIAMMRLMPGVWSKLKKLAESLPHDIAVMGDTQQGRPLAADPWTSVAAPALVLTGGKSPAGFHDAAHAIAELMPETDHRVLDGLNHGAVMMAPKKLAPALIEFFS